MVRAKFQVQGIKSVSWNRNGKELTLAPHYDQSVPEDQAFSRYTPTGELKMFVDNPIALEQLQLGKFFYLDLTPID